MNTVLKYIVSIILLLSFISCSEDLVDTVKTGTLSGKVVKKGTNEALANVKIYTSPTTKTVFTATDGTFTIEDIPIGDYSVKAELQGYLDKYEGVNITNANTDVTVVFEMSDDNSLNSPPTAPVLISPIDNATELPTSVTLTWNATDADTKDILTYTLVVKNDYDSNVIKIENISDKTYTLNNLRFGANYFWQIIASDGVNKAVNSNIFHFKTSSTPPNRYHYVQKSNGNFIIVSSNEDGSSKFNLTENTSNSFRPKLNNDTGLIAFIRNIGGNNQIFTSKKDGTDVKQVTTIPVTGFSASEISFSWNKTGNQIIYPNFNKLYKINKDGSGLVLLYTTPDSSIISECDWSYDGSKIALKTNNLNGYNAKIYIIDLLGNTIKTILSGINGATGGINFSIQADKLMYTRDITSYQDSNYRILDSHIFIYNLNTDTVIDISSLSDKPAGTNDLNPRFSPNDAEIIFVNTSNDGISQKSIIKIPVNFNSSNNARTTLFTNAEMPDWE